MMAHTRWYQVTFLDWAALMVVLSVMYALRRDQPAEFVIGTFLVGVAVFVSSRLIRWIQGKYRSEN